MKSNDLKFAKWEQISNCFNWLPEEGIDPEWSPEAQSMKIMLILARGFRFFFTYATKQKDSLT